ncbi:MAG: hypothetical protein ACFE95_22185 [Candidatus Hodarchaeota archaeon]
MSVEIDLKKIKDWISEKWHSFYQFYKENRRAFIRFEIGLIIGLIMWGVINSVFAITAFIFTLSMGILGIILLFFLKVFGVEDEAFKFWGRFADTVGSLENAEHSLDLLPSTTNLVADVMECFNAFIKALTRLGVIIFDNLAITFPILLDIRIDIDWLHVSLPYIFRTLFNLIQFIVLYYFMKKVKNRIRQRVKEEVKFKTYVWFGK